MVSKCAITPIYTLFIARLVRLNTPLILTSKERDIQVGTTKAYQTAGNHRLSVPQGSLNGTPCWVEDQTSSKSMVILRDVPYNKCMKFGLVSYFMTPG